MWVAPCWSISFPISFILQRLGSSVALVVFFPFSHIMLNCYFVGEYLCVFSRTVLNVWEECPQKNLTALPSHPTPLNPFFQLSFARKPTTFWGTTGLMCCKLSLWHWPKLSPNHMHHGLPHLHLLAIPLLVFGLKPLWKVDHFSVYLCSTQTNGIFVPL